jgi:hypothetical protein
VLIGTVVVAASSSSLSWLLKSNQSVVIIERVTRDRACVGETNPNVNRIASRLRNDGQTLNRATHQNLSTATMIPIIVLLFPLLAHAYTWQFTSSPSQCKDVSIAVEGSGHPPYTLLLIPYGPSPLSNNVEVRTIRNIPFSGDGNTLSFQLNYPENSSFVAVVSRYSPS